MKQAPKKKTPAKKAKADSFEDELLRASALSSGEPAAALEVLLPLLAEHSLEKATREQLRGMYREHLTSLHKTHGFVLARLGRHREAVDAYERGQKCDGIESEGCGDAAIELLLDVLDDADAIISRCERALADDDGAPNVERLSLLGRAYLRAGRLNEAEKTYRAILASLDERKTKVDGYRKHDGGESGASVRARDLRFVRRDLETYADRRALRPAADPILAWLK